MMGFADARATSEVGITRRDCVLRALAHQEPVCQPYHVQFTQTMRKHMAEFYGDPDFESKIGNFLLVRNTKPANAEVEVRPGFWRDQFGILWDRTVDRDIGVPAEALVDLERIDAYRFPDPDDPSRYARYAQARKEHPDLFFVVNHSKALFEISWMLAGMSEVLMALVAEPERVHRLMDRVMEFNLRVLDHVCRQDVDAVMFGDDYGTQNGLIMSPACWREFIKPRLGAMCQRVKAAGKFVFLHSCGNVRRLLPDLIECGVDVLNPFQPEVMDLADVKREFGDRLTFYGGISTQRTLPQGTPEQTREEVRRLSSMIGRRGGYIAAPAHAIPGDARPENVAAMIESMFEKCAALSSRRSMG